MIVSKYRIKPVTTEIQMNQKPRIVKDYDKIQEELKEQIKLNYPDGFLIHLIKFTNAKGELVSALPFDTDEAYYLIRMTKAEAQEIIEDDDDYDDDGMLLDDVRDDYLDKYDPDEDEGEIDEDYN
jgi:hypothetical protein